MKVESSCFQIQIRRMARLTLAESDIGWTLIRWAKRCQINIVSMSVCYQGKFPTKGHKDTNCRSRKWTDPKLGFVNSPASCSHWRVGGAPRSNQPLNHQSAAGMVFEAILPIEIYIKARYVVHDAGQWRLTSAPGGHLVTGNSLTRNIVLMVHVLFKWP